MRKSKKAIEEAISAVDAQLDDIIAAEIAAEIAPAFYSEYNKVAGGKWNVINQTLNRVRIVNTQTEAKRIARDWDNELHLIPRVNRVSTAQRKRNVKLDIEGNPLPTKTELIQEGVRKGMTYKAIAAYANCIYQMAYNIGTRYAKAYPQMVGCEKEVTE